MTAAGDQAAAPKAAVPPGFRFAGAGDAHMVAVVRSLLAAAGLLIIWVNPDEPARLLQLTYASLGVYFLYSVALVFILQRRPALASRRSLLWADVGFATYLVALTEGTNSIFFFFFFFSILATSFTRGYRDGIIVTLASGAGFIMASMVALPQSAILDVDRMLIRPVSLLLLGYMMAHWGGFELALKRKLALLNTLQSSSNPRLGKDHLILSSLAGLRDFFRADSCVLVVSRVTDPFPIAYQVGADGAGPGASVHTLSEVSAPHFQGLAAEPFLYPLPGHKGWRKCWRRLFAPRKALSTADQAAASRHEAVAHLLDATAMASAPYLESPGCRGHVFVVARCPRDWRRDDGEFLAQWAGTLAALVNNVTLTEELISHAADYARRDLSRDLHDMTIQPYVGLKYALEALLRACPQDLPLRQRIEETVAMAHVSIEELRTHASEIRFGTIFTAQALSVALASQARRLLQLFGVEVRVEFSAAAGLSSKASTLIHRVVTEGLNNILRHTTARQASVVIGRDADAVSVEIRNECSTPLTTAFTPKSITDRVTEVGGTVSVSHSDGMTAVLARIPLEVCRVPA